MVTGRGEGDIVSRIGAEVSSRLSRDDAGPSCWVKRRTVLGWAGLTRPRRSTLHQISPGLKKASPPIFTSPPDLGDAGPDDTIHFSYQQFDEPGGGIKDEHDLFQALQLFQRSIPQFRGLTLQPQVRQGRQIIDVVGQSKTRYVVIELKVGDGGYGVVDQLLTYLRTAREGNEVAGRKLSGMIISGRSNPDQQRELKKRSEADGFLTSWLVFEQAFRLRPPGQPSPS